MFSYAYDGGLLHDHIKIAKKNKAIVMLMLLTSIWGTTFALVQKALPDMSPVVFGALRFGFAYLIFIAFSKSARDGTRVLFNPRTPAEREIRKMAVLLGFTLGAGYILQFIGLQTTTTSKSAFLTATTVIWTPLISRIITKEKFRILTLIAISLSILGILFLTHPYPLEGIVIGDIFTTLCSISFGIYIFQLDRTLPKALALEGTETGGVLMISAMQLLMGLVCICLAFPFVEIHFVPSGNALFALAYTTILATALSTYMQSMYQKEITPTAAVLIYTLEPVVATIIAYLFMNEQFTAGEWLGAGLIVGGMLLGQIRDEKWIE